MGSPKRCLPARMVVLVLRDCLERFTQSNESEGQGCPHKKIYAGRFGQGTGKDLYQSLAIGIDTDIDILP